MISSLGLPLPTLLQSVSVNRPQPHNGVVASAAAVVTAMPDGSRSRKGCLTCRIRKKKCDEHRPECQACNSRQLTCYAYSTPLPSWYTDKSNWEQVKNSKEARALKALAETRYKIRRKLEAKSSPLDSTNTSVTAQGDEEQENWPLSFSSAKEGTSMISVSSSRRVVTPNTWQLYPESIWWDSTMNSLTPQTKSPGQGNTRLLMVFLEVIHPITHTFYKLSSQQDRSWFLNRLVSDEALYDVSLSVSACFEHSLTQPPLIDEIGICPKVRKLQNEAIVAAQSKVNAFETTEYSSLEEFVATGIRLLDLITNLLNLETFSMLQGSWEMHHQAARAILNSVETTTLSRFGVATSPHSSTIELALARLPPDDDRRRSVEFSITNFIWIDVVATSTFGTSSYAPCAFDYLKLLLTEKIKPQYTMGCHGWIMAQIVEIARLEQRKTTVQTQICTPDSLAEVEQQGNQLAEQIEFGIESLDTEQPEPIEAVAPSLDEDCRLVSILWAHAAHIFLQITIYESIDEDLINLFIQKLEELPSRLFMRVCWPYTIAGCMSPSKYHMRFRVMVAKTMQHSHPPGLTWKGLIVMEECWRLRQNHDSLSIGWREAMQSLGARVLLV
jgi:C6 transcription factor Pro1